jgi:pyridoxal phosphate enzyme (YggS family)
VIRENLLKIRARIASCCAKAGRLNLEVTLVCVIKSRSLEEIQEVLAAGIEDIGENKVQEALLHYKAIADTFYAQRTKWHMIGHLQTNKVKEAVGIFDLIHSVDSFRLAQEIDKQAAKINKIQDILVEVNTSREESKFGVKPAELWVLVKIIRELKNVRLLGLMTMAAQSNDSQKSRPYFRKLRELKEEMNKLNGQNKLIHLSMGMSGDFEVAIEEGASLMRIGTAIFEGQRP